MFVDDIQSLMEIAKFIEDIYKQNAKRRPRFYYSILCQKYAKQSEIIQKALPKRYFLLHICYMMLVFSNAFNEERVPLFHLYLPGINMHSMGGAIFVNVFNYVSITTVYFIMCSFDLLIFMIFTNMPMVSLVMIGHLDELREELLEEDRIPSDIKNRLIQIVVMHNKYNE